MSDNGSEAAKKTNSLRAAERYGPAGMAGLLAAAGLRHMVHAGPFIFTAKRHPSLKNCLNTVEKKILT